MTIQSSNNDLNYLIDPTFTKANRLFFCHLQEFLQKTIQQKIIEVFHIIMNQMSK